MQSLQRSIRSAPGRSDAFGAAFEATGLVVACVAGGHILLATAGVAGFGLNAAQQYMTDSLGKLKKNLWKVQVLHLVLQVSGEHSPMLSIRSLMLSATGKVTWLRFCGGHQKFCQTIKPNKFESNSHEGGTYAGRFAFEIFNSTSPPVISTRERAFRCHRSSRRRPSKWSPRWWIRGINFTRWSFRWHDRGTRPLLSPFLFGKKTIHPKKPDLRLAGCAGAKALWMACKPALFCRQRFLRTEIEGTVLNKMLFFFGLHTTASPVRGCVGWMYPAPEPVPISDVELEEQNKRLIQRSRHNLRRCWVHEHHLCLKHFFRVSINM